MPTEMFQNFILFFSGVFHFVIKKMIDCVLEAASICVFF